MRSRGSRGVSVTRITRRHSTVVTKVTRKRHEQPPRRRGWLYIYGGRSREAIFLRRRTPLRRKTTEDMSYYSDDSDSVSEYVSSEYSPLPPRKPGAKVWLLEDHETIDDGTPEPIDDGSCARQHDYADGLEKAVVDRMVEPIRVASAAAIADAVKNATIGAGKASGVRTKPLVLARHVLEAFERTSADIVYRASDDRLLGAFRVRVPDDRQ